jgi:ribokinase
VNAQPGKPSLAILATYVFGFHLNVPRLPVAGESLFGNHLQPEHGGKGSNQAVAAARLGARVRIAAALGKDALGDGALALWRDEGIEVEYLLRASDRPTGGFCAMILPDGNNYTVVDPGANLSMTPRQVAAAEPMLEGSRLLLANLETSVETIEAAFAMARREGVTTVLTPGPYTPMPASLLQLTDVLVPNEVEARNIAGLPPDAPLTPERLAEEIVALGPRTAVITQGEAGVYVLAAEDRFQTPAFPVRSLDPVGAGDSFLAGLSVALAEGRSLREAVRRGCASGALAVQRFGVIPGLPTRAQVDAFLAERPA